MPSGYTAAIKDGITFSDFAMNCARAFGALISMRDEPLDAPIPERVEPTDYHAEKIKKAEERLSALIAMTAKELDAEAAEYWERETAYNKKAHEEAEELRKKYKAMAELINAWEPPTSAHVGLKEFMQSQIELSVNSDCNLSYLEDPEPISGELWLKSEMIKAAKEIEYGAKKHVEELARVDMHNKWLADLRGSLEANG